MDQLTGTLAIFVEATIPIVIDLEMGAHLYFLAFDLVLLFLLVLYIAHCNCAAALIVLAKNPHPQHRKWINNPEKKGRGTR